jgi:hypothetical protein
MQPTKESVRKWIREQVELWHEERPQLQSMEEIRRELGWDASKEARNRLQ